MHDPNQHLGFPVPVLNGKGEPNFENIMVFSPVIRGTGVRFMTGFTKPYTPPDPPPDWTPGGTPMSGNVVPFKSETSNSNVIPLRKVA